MRTLLTIKQQNEWLAKNHATAALEHKWSVRGTGSSKIRDRSGNIIGKASGCGYDRFGAAFGNAIQALFPSELLYLAKRSCKGARSTYKGSTEFYGLFYNAEKEKAWLDGACGSSCMEKVLLKIGFLLIRIGSTDTGHSGSDFYSLIPITARARKYF